MEESIYDENGNLKIPVEQVLDKTLTELARKNYEIAQLQTAVEILQKEVTRLNAPAMKSNKLEK